MITKYYNLKYILARLGDLIMCCIGNVTDLITDSHNMFIINSVTHYSEKHTIVTRAMEAYVADDIVNRKS